MEQFLPENWAYMHMGLIFSITCAQLLVIYVLSDSSNPPAGLGLYTVYFMAAMLGWIAFTLQMGTGTQMGVDVPSVAAILNSYILFMAAGQRAGITRGRFVFGAICLLGCLSVFFLAGPRMFTVQISAAALFFAGSGILCAWRAFTQRNIGDAIIACAGLVMVVGIPLALYDVLAAGDFKRAQAIALGVHSAAYALVAVGFLASVLIEYQQHLSQLATKDPLTRLLNRRGLEDALYVTIAQASRRDLDTAAIMVDIDHFRKVNDSFGHEVGDLVIRQIAEYLQRMSRASDVVARTGGEEYLLILPDTGLEAARSLAERIQAAIGDTPLSVSSHHLPVTVSLGVTCVTGRFSLDELIREAARALSQAKQGGRNRVASVQNKPLHLKAAVERS
jgi:diguanylate cyclase (GGDEF)-like protein